MRYIIRDIKLPFDSPKDEAINVARKRLLDYFSYAEIGPMHISKQSVDARKRDHICFVWTVQAEICSGRKISPEKLIQKGIVAEKKSGIVFERGTELLEERPLIVGFGPCGMFCALILAQEGYCPIVIERGSDVSKRTLDVENFYKNGILNPASNIQFGAGGAGTFSDGKLVTRINDEACQTVIDTFYRFGAPEEILYKAKPHIGTDYLKITTENIRDEIRRLGGEIHFDTQFLGILSSGGKITGVRTTEGDIACGALVLAVGHSARDTFRALKEESVHLTPKPFSVGLRIEHLQEDIDRALYGVHAGHPALPKGEYNFSHHTSDGRCVYTFCMCPGGEVVGAASEPEGVVTNGMSNFLRDGKNANSAIAVSVSPEDFGNDIWDAISFQRNIEHRAFLSAGSNYNAPVSTLKDFMNGQKGGSFTKVLPTYRNGKVSNVGFDGIFPDFILKDIREGISDFDHKINGFADPSAVLTGPETRTSSPVRIPRNDLFIADSPYNNLYPCGEGAGYAGGITSAGVDGIHCAMEIIRRFQFKKN